MSIVPSLPGGVGLGSNSPSLASSSSSVIPGSPPTSRRPTSTLVTQSLASPPSTSSIDSPSPSLAPTTASLPPSPTTQIQPPTTSSTLLPTTTSAVVPVTTSSLIPSTLSATTAPTSSSVAPTSTRAPLISTITPSAILPSRSLTTTQYTTTSGGQIVIVTSVITAIISGAPDSSSSTTSSPLVLNGAQASGSSGFFNNPGAVAGTFVVVALVIIGLFVALFFIYLRRKRARQLDRDTRQAYGGAGDGGAGVNKFGNDEEEDGNPFNSPRSDGGHKNGGGAYAGARPMSQSFGGPVVPAAAYGHRMSSGALSGEYGAGNQYRLSQESSHSGSGSANGMGMGSQNGYLPQVSLGATMMAGYGQQYGGPGSQEGIVGGYSEWPEQTGQSANGSGESPAEVVSGSGEETAGSTSLSNSQHSSQHRQSRHIVRDSVDSIYPGDYAARKSLPPPPAAHLDDRLDPQTIYLAQHSEGDEHDFTRRILRVANPEDDD